MNLEQNLSIIKTMQIFQYPKITNYLGTKIIGNTKAMRTKGKIFELSMHVTIWVIGNPHQVRHLGHLNVPSVEVVIFLKGSIIELIDVKQYCWFSSQACVF
jgi:hypothetical protein